MSKISGVCVGESLVGEGNEVAHVDLLIGPRGSAVETAYCNALTNNKDGFTTLLALVAPSPAPPLRQTGHPRFQPNSRGICGCLRRIDASRHEIARPRCS